MCLELKTVWLIGWVSEWLTTIDSTTTTTINHQYGVPHALHDTSNSVSEPFNLCRYPSFAIQNILIHGNGKQEQEQRWHATDDHSTGIWHSSIFSVHHMSITSRTITKWADVGYCFAIANLVFGISSVKYLTLGIVMERMFAWSTKAVLGRKTVVSNVLEENGKKNKKGMTEL